MKPQYKQAYEQIRKLTSDKLYRFATDLLYLADAQRGHVDASQQDICALHGGAWNNVRRALAELREQGVIYCMNADGMCLITFRSWLNYPTQTAESDQNERENEPENAEIRANGQSITTRAEDGQRANFARKVVETDAENEPENAEIRANGDDGIGIGMVGRYKDLNTNTIPDLPIPTYLPTNTVDHARANGNGYHANGHSDTATGEAETDAPLQQNALSPDCGEPPSPLDDAERIVAILTDEEIGLTPTNAERVARLHTFPFVVKQIASWWDDGKLGPGALFKNRLMNARQFPPGRFSEEFRASELYARHYPLKGPDLHLWRQWQEHRDHINQVTGLEDVAAWANALPASLRRTLEQLPVPTGEVYGQDT